MAGPPSAPPPAARPRRGIAQIFAVLALSAGGGAVRVRARAGPGHLHAHSAAACEDPGRLERAGQKQMLMKADKINYDYANHLVSAVGDVQIYYKARRWRPTRSSTTSRPSACTRKATSA